MPNGRAVTEERSATNVAVAGAWTDAASRVAADYLHAIDTVVRQIDPDAIARVVNRLRAARDRGATIYVAGNGGSAATASHFVNDLGKFAKISRRAPIRAMCLSDNTPWLTALANDEGYERVFAGQLENFARRGDVLILISASGNSPNLLRAAELAAVAGVAVIGFLGFDGGRLLDDVDDVLLIPTPRGAYGLVEDSHAILCHIVATCLAEDRCAPEEDAYA